MSGHRVLVVIQNISYTHDTRVRNIAESLVAAGFDVSVVCPRMAGDPRRAVRDGVSVRFLRLPILGSGLVSLLLEYACSLVVLGFRVPWLCVRGRIGVVHVCVPPHTLFPLVNLLRALRRAVVIDQHDLLPELFDLRYSGRAGRARRLVCAAERRALRGANEVLVANDTAARRAVERSGIDPTRVTVVRSGPPVHTNARPTPGVSGVSVGFIGNMAAQDCVDHLVRVAAYIRRTRGRRDISFVCVGDGTALRAVRRLAADLGVTDGIEFTGRLPHEAGLQRLSNCDICVQPDLRNPFNDSCTMLKALEYMALGKPVVAVDLTETRVTCGEAALYAADDSAEEFGDLILTLADNASLRDRLAAEGLRRARGELAWVNGERRLLEVYNRIPRLGRPTTALDRPKSDEDIEFLAVEPARYGMPRRRKQRRQHVH